VDDRLDSKGPKSKLRHPDRVTLLPAHLSKLDDWIVQVTTKHRGVRLTRNNVTQWMLEQFPQELSKTDETALAERFYDEDFFLRSIVREMRSRKASGEQVSLATLLESSTRPVRARASRQTKRPGPLDQAAEIQDPLQNNSGDSPNA
jgi:hypothetical protein